MQVVINIPDEAYALLKSKPVSDNIAECIIANGVPLPKGHGDLIDRDALIQKQFIPNLGFDLVDLDNLKIAPTVIPADKEDKDASSN